MAIERRVAYNTVLIQSKLVLHPRSIGAIAKLVACEERININELETKLLRSSTDLIIDLSDYLVDLIAISSIASRWPSNVGALECTVDRALGSVLVAVVHLHVSQMNDLSLPAGSRFRFVDSLVQGRQGLRHRGSGVLGKSQGSITLLRALLQDATQQDMDEAATVVSTRGEENEIRLVVLAAIDLFLQDILDGGARACEELERIWVQKFVDAGAEGALVALAFSTSPSSKGTVSRRVRVADNRNGLEFADFRSESLGVLLDGVVKPSHRYQSYL